MEKNNASVSEPSESFGRLPDSETYLQKLEHKLSKLKGQDKPLQSKDLLSGLQSLRNDQMTHLNASSNASSFLPQSLSEEKEISLSYVERKLFPQKNALTYEELQHLLEADILAKLTAENSQDSDKNIDR